MKASVALALCLLIVPLASAVAYGQANKTTTIRGRVVDAETGEGLIGATVVVGTSVIGVATSYDGTFTLRGVEGDSAQLNVAFIGFQSKRIAVELNGEEINLGVVALEVEYSELSEVIITASLEGQQKALNQQYSADNIKNVVSADLIGRFPDLNVAEALQRVPGVNISRSRGEGSTVSLRGTPAFFTTININGEQIPSTQEGGSRNESLDLIPADQLASMEIIKALTPDMDGDAIGGSVNLITPQARGMDLQLKAEAGGGYNSLSQSYNAIGRFKIGRRFIEGGDGNGKLGVLAGFSYFETDNEEDKLEVVWSPASETPIVSLETDTVVIENHQLSDLKNQRRRMGATLTLDYDFSLKSNIIFNFMYSRRSDLDDRNRSRLILNQSGPSQFISLDTILNTELRRDVAFRDYFSENLSYNLEGEHVIGQVELDWGLYYADSRREEDRIGGRFERGPANRVDLVVANDDQNGIYNTFPEFQTLNAEFDLHNPFLITDVDRYEIIDLNLESDNAVAKFNALVPYKKFGANGSFKFGMKYRRQSNSRLRDNRLFGFSDPNRVIDERAGFASVVGDFEDENYLNNNMRFGPGVDEDKFRAFIDDNENLFVFDEIRSNRNTFNSTYDASEEIIAGYAMNRLQFDRVMVLAGVRYETNKVDYDAFEVNNVTGAATPVSDGTTYDFFLPNVHFKYGINRLTNLRAAVTWSYARANFDDLVPFLRIQEDGSRIEAGNPELKPGSSLNVDVLAERYLGTVGIISAGVFYKDIDNFQFSRNLRFLRPGDPFYEEFPGFQFQQEQNGENAQVYGFEFNSQVGLTFLPGILKGIGLYFNYTFTESDAFTNDRTGISLPGQAKHTWNGAMSFDYKNLSIKGSLNYNGSFLSTVAGEQENDLIRADRLQVDINTSYRITERFRMFGEFLNVTNAPAIVYQGTEDRVAEYAYFGWWNRFGLSFNL